LVKAGDRMRVVVLGTGALGCVFSAKLAEVAEVWMLGTWTDGVAAVQRDGVSVQEPDGSILSAGVLVAADPKLVPHADVALILVKSYQTERAAAWAGQVLSDDGLAVSLQNGLDNAAKIATAVGSSRAAMGVTYLAATLLGPGRVRLVANLATYVEQHSSIAGRVERFVSLLRQGGLEADTTDDIQQRLWVKAIANAAINPLTALWRIPNGGVCRGADRRGLMVELATEAANVAKACGVILPFEDAVAYAESVCKATAQNHSSMLQDIERGRATEIDSISGIIVAEGRRLGISTPVSQVIWRLVRGLSDATEPGSTR
jgi:2-dehydropantoate 2-reductase